MAGDPLPCAPEWAKRFAGSGPSGSTASAYGTNSVNSLALYDDDGAGPHPERLIATGDLGSETFPHYGVHTSQWTENGWARLGNLGLTGFGNTATGRVMRSVDWDGPGGSPPVLMIGGLFTYADSTYSPLICAWDGHDYRAMGSGLSSPALSGTDFVRDVVTFDPDGAGPAPLRLYAAGSFYGSLVSPSYLAMWNGSHWSGVAGGISSSLGSTTYIMAMKVFDDDGDGPHQPELIVAGIFQNAGGLPVQNIAKWNGVTWSAMGEGLSGTNKLVGDLEVFDEDGAGPNPPRLFATGTFERSGVTTMNGIARWNGTAWSAVRGAGATSGGYADVWDPDGAGPITPGLYVIGISAANTIQRWDGSAWSVPPVAHSGGVKRIFVLDSDDDGPSPPRTFALGNFTVAPSTDAHGVAEWNGSAWIPLTTGFNLPADVNALRVFDDGSGPALFAGGRFLRHAQTALSRIGKFDGTTWTALGVGVNDRVRSMVDYDPDGPSGNPPRLVVAGDFTLAGGATANRIAQWDGANWSTFGTGFNNIVRALCLWDDDGAGPNPTSVFAGGAFTTANGSAANRIARWDGSTWHPLGAGLGSTVNAIIVWDDDGAGPNAAALYVCGTFSTAGGLSANGIAKWDGSAWSALGAGLTPTTFGGGAYSLVAFDEDGAGPNPPALFAGGAFNQAGGQTINRIARWNGSTWSGLGQGLGSLTLATGSNTVFSLTSWDDGTGGGPALYAGGGFMHAGTALSRGLAKWNGVSWETFGDAVGADGAGGNGIFAMAAFDDGMGRTSGLYVGGNFGQAGNVGSRSFARWGCATASPATTIIYGLKCSVSGIGDSQPPTHLFSFTADGSTFTNHGAVTLGGSPIDVDGLAYSQQYGLLAFQIEAAASRLLSIDPATAAATIIGPAIGFRKLRASTFDANGNLVAIDSANNEMVVVDPSGGSILCPPVPMKVGGEPFDVHYICDAATRTNGELIFTSADETMGLQRIFLLDAETGDLIDIGTGGDQFFAGITFADGVPLGRMFALTINGPDAVISCNANSGFSHTMLFPDIIPRINSGAGDLAAIVASTGTPGCPPMSGLPGSFNLDLGNYPDLDQLVKVPELPYGAAAAQPGYWNVIRAVSAGAPMPIFNLHGLTTPVTFTAGANAQAVDYANPGTLYGDDRLLDDVILFGVPGSQHAFDIDGLPVGTYDLFTYAWHPESPTALNTIDVNGAGAQTVGGAWPGALTLGVTHALHQVEATDGSLAIAVNVVATAGAIGGLQAVRQQTPMCGADVNCDGFINVTDLLLIISSWGMCSSPCPADINFDGAVNVTDLLAVISGWGAAPTGACCLPDRTCVQRVAATCSSSNGVFFGTGVSCGNVTCAPVAANDYCQWAKTAVTGVNHWNNQGAGSDSPFVMDDACGGADVFTRDVWFTYTATCTGLVNFNTFDTSYPFFDTVLQIYAGGSCQPLSAVLACSDDDASTGTRFSSIDRYMTAGQTYLIRCGSAGFHPENDGPALLNISCGGAPPNDHCDDAITAIDGANAWNNSTADYLTPFGVCSGTSALYDVWFNYTASCTGVLTLDTFGSIATDPIIVVTNTHACSPLGAVLGCNSNAPLVFPANESDCFLTLGVVAGQQIKIRVGSTFLLGTGEGVLNIHCGPPINDRCADAITIESGSHYWSNVGADTDGPPIDPGCASTADRDVWFNYVVPFTGIVRMDTYGSGPPLSDTVLAVYDGSACDPIGLVLACDDDGLFNPISKIWLNASEGQILKIRCMSFGTPASNQGLAILNITCGSTPPNDMCADALIAVDGENTWDNSGATLDGPLEAPCYTGGTRDVWFNYTATCTGTLLIESEGTLPAFDRQILVYAGHGCSPLGPQLGCATSFGLAGVWRINLNVVAGDQLKIRCESTSGAAKMQGTALLNITPCAVPPPNDNCIDAIHLGIGNIAPMAFNNALATRDGALTGSACVAGAASNLERDVWYRWTAGPDADGVVTIRARGATFYPAVLVYDDSPCGWLSSSVNFTCTPVIAGHTYIIRVGAPNLASVNGASVIEVLGNDP